VGLVERNTSAGTAIEPSAITPRWYGDPLDRDHITTALWCADHDAPFGPTLN
jgi:hypothetical protein